MEIICSKFSLFFSTFVDSMCVNSKQTEKRTKIPFSLTDTISGKCLIDKQGDTITTSHYCEGMDLITTLYS